MINPEFILQAINAQVFDGKYADVSIVIGQTDNPGAAAEMHWWQDNEKPPYILINQHVWDSCDFYTVFMLVLHELAHYSARAVAPDEHGPLFIAECRRIEAENGMSAYEGDFAQWPMA